MKISGISLIGTEFTIVGVLGTEDKAYDFLKYVEDFDNRGSTPVSEFTTGLPVDEWRKLFVRGILDEPFTMSDAEKISRALVQQAEKLANPPIIVRDTAQDSPVPVNALAGVKIGVDMGKPGGDKTVVAVLNGDGTATVVAEDVPAKRKRGRPRKTETPTVARQPVTAGTPAATESTAPAQAEAPTPASVAAPKAAIRGRLSSKGMKPSDKVVIDGKEHTVKQMAQPIKTGDVVAIGGEAVTAKKQVTDADLTKAASIAAGTVGPSLVRKIIAQFTDAKNINAIPAVKRHDFLSALDKAAKDSANLPRSK